MGAPFGEVDLAWSDVLFERHLARLAEMKRHAQERGLPVREQWMIYNARSGWPFIFYSRRRSSLP